MGAGRCVMFVFRFHNWQIPVRLADVLGHGRNTVTMAVQWSRQPGGIAPLGQDMHYCTTSSKTIRGCGNRAAPDEYEEGMQTETAAFFDDATNTVSYLVRDGETDSCAVVDSVLDFDFASGRTSTASADRIVEAITSRRLKLEWILESHVHADHLSAAPYIQQQLGGQIGIGGNVTVVQDKFGKIFTEGTEFDRDGSQFDRLFREGDRFRIGKLDCSVLETPGHTPACLTYVIGDAAFVGDTMFMPDFGSARADFPGGSAGDLFDSIQKILSLPDDTRIFVGHDYKAPGRNEFAWETTVGEQKEKNVHFGGGRSREEFVRLRTERDRTLSMPELIIPSIQVNMRAGNMPEKDEHGRTFLKVPVDSL